MPLRLTAALLGGGAGVHSALAPRGHRDDRGPAPGQAVHAHPIHHEVVVGEPLAVGGSPQAFAALASGQIAAAALSLPLNYAAEEQGFNTIGRFIDVMPHYQLSVYSVRRAWAEENRPVVVRFMKAIVTANRWLHANKEAAVDLLAKEMRLKPAYARKAWEFYTEKGLWHPYGDVTLEGLQVVLQIYGEQTQAKGPLPNPAKFVDQSFLKEALKELPGR